MSSSTEGERTPFATSSRAENVDVDMDEAVRTAAAAAAATASSLATSSNAFPYTFGSVTSQYDGTANSSNAPAPFATGAQFEAASLNNVQSSTRGQPTDSASLYGLSDSATPFASTSSFTRPVDIPNEMLDPSLVPTSTTTATASTSATGTRTTLTRLPRASTSASVTAPDLSQPLSLASSLIARLDSDRLLYQRAYRALNDELIKAQIEQSVLRNVKIIAESERDLMRHSSQRHT